MPSATPSTIPTSIPTTSYPTYTTSVAVYFNVAQVVTGVSSGQYESNKVSSDAILRQTIAQMIAFDVHSSDVSGITVATEGISAFATNTTTLTLLYSVSKSTYIFNDVNKATFAFITALNDSVSTGKFDSQLRVNSGVSNDLKSVTTVYITITTASPTSSPTSLPTSQPTNKDLITANILGTPLDTRVTRAKIQYYFGTFFAYFFGIYILLYAYSFTGLGKLTARKLYDSSFESHQKYIKSTPNTNCIILRDLEEKNELVSKMMILEGTIKQVRETHLNRGSASDLQSSDRHGRHGISWGSKVIVDIFETKDKEKYSKGYREYMQQERALLGCAPLLYPNGYTLRIPFLDPIALPPGRLEDFILYLCHNHPLFSCFYFMDGSKLGAHGNRILYVGKDIVVFVLYQFTNLLLQYFMLDGHGIGSIINILLITPAAVFIGLILKYLYVCPFTETVEFQRRYANFQWIIIFFGRLSIVPIMLIMSSALIIACIFSSGRRIPLIIVNFFVYVQFYGIVLAIAEATLVFVDNYYFRVSLLLGVIDVFRVGVLYKERIMTEGLVEGVDYAYRINHYLHGFIMVQKILNRDDAIKAKWINLRNEAAVDDIEMPNAYKAHSPMVPEIDEEDMRLSYSVYEYDADVDKISTNENTNALALPITGLVSNLFFSKNSNIVESDPIDSPTISSASVTENPLHSIKNNRSSNMSAVVVEDEACLYEEYKNICALRPSTDEVYSLSDEALMSFEEWKIKRKEFKKGTRGSFIRAFQIFEERVQAYVAPMDSTKHTMHLFSGKAKNALSKSVNSRPSQQKL